MEIRSQGSKEQGSETIPEGSRLQAKSKRSATQWVDEIVRDPRKREAAQKIMNDNYRIADNGCWEWTGGTSHGYGELRLAPGTVPIYAHRLSYVLAHGPMTNGTHILHKCDNPICVNPTHLFNGTQEDNMKDMARKGRGCLGPKNAQTKLTEKQVVQIRNRSFAGERGGDLAKEFGISIAQVSRIVKGIRWQWAGGPIISKHGNWKHGLYSAAQK